MILPTQTKQSLFLIGITILFLSIDLGQFFLIGTAIIPLLLCFYCIVTLHHQKYILLIFIAFLQCIESFCFYNSFSLTVILFAPLTILAYVFRKNLYPSRAHLITLIIVGMFIQIYAIERYLFGIIATKNYTIIRISGILLTTICFSLTLKYMGYIRQSRVNYGLREESPDF